MTPSSDDFGATLRDLLTKAESLGFVAVEINSGNLHRTVGGYPGNDHRMPICCEVMHNAMTSADKVVFQPDSGTGASVVVRYALPRQ